MTAAADQLPALLSIPQLAAFLGVSHSTLYAQLRQGALDYPTVMVGADVRVPRDAVLLRHSGVASDVARLNAEVAGLRADVAMLTGALRQIFGGFAAAFDASSVPHTVSMGDRLGTGEKYHEEEDVCRECPPQPLEGRAAGLPLGARGDHRREAAPGGLQSAPRPSGGRREQSCGATLPAAPKTKRSPGTGERVVG